MRTRIAIFGSNGLLGRSLFEFCRTAGDDIAAFSHEDCDIADRVSVIDALERAQAEVVFNAAAATDVDRCEKDPTYAHRGNALAPRVLAAACREAGARLVHVSTDYVFDGEKGAPYDELDLPTPISAYGRSKLAGEQAVLAAEPLFIVARTAWLYGQGGKNFVSKMPDILREKGEITAVSDQWSSPSYAPDVASRLRQLAHRGMGGLYHVANGGKASYHEVALEAARALGIDESKVRAQPSSAIPRPAARPRATPLATVALPAEKFDLLRPWADAYRSFVDRTGGGGSGRKP